MIKHIFVFGWSLLPDLVGCKVWEMVSLARPGWSQGPGDGLSCQIGRKVQVVARAGWSQGLGDGLV